MQTARTCAMSVTPWSTFSIPSILRVQHAFLERYREDLGDAGVLLDQLLDRVGADEQLVQARAALVPAAAADVAALRLVELEVGLAEAVVLLPKRSNTFL